MTQDLIAAVVKEIGKPIAETGCGLLRALLGKPCEIAGEMISDELYRWQWQRRIEILEKAQQRLTARGLNAKVLPKGFFLSYLQHAGEIEADELQELWANLLASAVESEANQHPSFVHVLKQLSVLEARILAAVGGDGFSFKTLRTDRVKGRQRETVENSAQFNGLSDPMPDAQSAFVALCHLNELGLISVQFRAKKTGSYSLPGTNDSGDTESVEETGHTALTTFGSAFFAACAPNSNVAKAAKIIDGWRLLGAVREVAYEAAASASSAGADASSALDQLGSFKAVDLR